jgi:beta-lactamase class C
MILQRRIGPAGPRSGRQSVLDQLRIVALGLVFLLLPGAAAALDLSSFDREFSRLLASDRVPGGAYAIVDGDRILSAAGHGVRSAAGREPVTVDTVFRLASVSKPFAAHLTAVLVDEGVLSWNEPVRHSVPQFELADPRHSDSLQLQHLIGQSVGVVPNAYDNLLDADQSLDQILPQFARLQPLCRPGECYTYQNVLFSLVEPVIESATGRPYEELLTERIFQPLGMHDSSVGLEAFRAAPNRAVAHVRASRHLPWVPALSNANYYRVAPAAGVNSSVSDLADWLIAQMGHRPTVIDEAPLMMLTESRVRTSRELRRRGWRDLLTDAHYGLGWRIYQLGEETIYLHSGWVRGFVAEVAFSRQRQIGLVVLLNAETRALNEITTTFWRAVLSSDLQTSNSREELGAPAPVTQSSAGGAR